MEAMGSHLTNKYAEGYPAHRYYGGCQYVDIAENLAIERAKKLFGAEHANVQPHSGANANFAVYYACLKPGDTILGMSLAHGGHLTHGSPVTVSGNYYRAVGYGVSETTQTIDYDALERLAEEEKPKIIVSGASAYPRVIDFARIRAICDKVGAYMMVDIAHIAAALHCSLRIVKRLICEGYKLCLCKLLRSFACFRLICASLPVFTLSKQRCKRLRKRRLVSNSVIICDDYTLYFRYR